MTAAPTIEPRSLAPWWSAEKCRTHQPFPTLRAAEKAAELHPIFSTKCPKCDEGMKVQPFKCHSAPRPMHWHIGHDFSRTQEGTRMTLPALGNIEALRPKLRGSKPKLSGEQAREIFVEAGTGPLSENRAKQLGSKYGIHWTTIYSIVSGRAYAWATADLRPTVAPKVEAKPIAVEAVKAEPKRDHDIDAHEWAERERIKEEFQAREAERKARAEVEAERQWIRTDLSALMTPAGDPSTKSALLADLADALEVLLGTLDMPLPKFVTLDTESIRRLVEQARKVNGS